MSDYPPPARWVCNVQPTTKFPWSRFVGRHILRGSDQGPVLCRWATTLGEHEDPFEQIILTKDLQVPGGLLRWELRFKDVPNCLATNSIMTDALGQCCIDLHWDIFDVWFGTLCFFGPGPSPDIDVWPVRFDFEETDL